MNVEARLRAFAAVARTGSFSRAAEQLFVSQPAISKHVASLEAELATRLVDRGRSGATLTPAGRTLADYVLRAEALLANARRAVGGDPETGVLSLAASGIPGTYLLPERLAEFHRAYPEVEIDFVVHTSGNALEAVRAHDVELAVVGGLDVPSELEPEPLVDDELVLVGPPALGGRRLRPRDLAGHTWISREEGSSTRAAVEAARWQLGLHAVRTLELPSWEAVKLAVARGAGITAISRSALDLELEAGALAVLDVPRWRVVRTISVVRARGVPLTPPAARFLELLRQAYAATPDARPPNSNLPAHASPLVGRRRELEELRTLLRRARTRLVTLTGAGGSGKTRLAAEVAAAFVDDFRDGVYLVELASLDDAALVLPTVLRTVGARDLEELADRRLLVIVDNFEHVLDAAPDIATLLARARRLRLLVTSRAPLGIDGERVYALEPLRSDDAVALFVERALAVDPQFVDDGTVRAVCERVDRLPLAIELAAARVRAFSLPTLLALLEQRLSVLAGARRDSPSRHRTLRMTIEWSYGLLDEDHRRVLATVAVFRGGFTDDAAAEVCGASRDALAVLVDSSLVVRDEDRWTMLETVREYAAERLAADGGADELRRRHATFFLRFAEAARRHARGPDALAWLDRTEAELDNVRAALEWTLGAGEGAIGLALAEALEPYWYRRLQLREGLRWLEALLGRAPDAAPALRAGALGVAARLASELGEPGDRALRWYEESLALARASGDGTREAWALHGLGFVSFRDGDVVRARELFEQSHALFARLGEHGPAGGRMTYLALVARREGDRRAEIRYLERALDHYRTAGDMSGHAATAATLGEVMLAEGDVAGALRTYRALLPETTERGDRPFLYLGIAAAAATRGDLARAGRLSGSARRILEELDRPLLAEETSVFDELLREVDERDVERGRALSDDETLALARDLVEAAG